MMVDYPIMVFEASNTLDLSDLYLSLPEEQHSILSQLENTLKLQNRQLQFDNQIFNLIGVNKKIIADAFEVLENSRHDLKIQLESSDLKDRDEAASLLSQKVTEALLPLINDPRFKMEFQQYEEQVKEELTTSVWNKLAEESRRFLITAHFTFDQLSMMNQSESVDFSCVCMLVTKALELETTKRFYDGYINYLKTQQIETNSWPFGLLERNRDSLEILNRNSYTLGSVLYTAGLRNNNNDGQRPSLEVSHVQSYGLFCDYYRDVLLKSTYERSIADKVFDDCELIEVVRIDYRNPSAHKNSIDRVGAQNCLDYLLTVEKKMFHMLKDMRR